MRDVAVVDAIRAALVDADETIVAAWVFGSVARGDARQGSDVDVAVLRDVDAAPSRLVELPLDLEDRLGRALRRDVQVVDVARASADLVHRVLRDGVLLVDRDRARRIQFEVDSRNRYFDMAPVWRRYRAGSRVG